MTDESAFLDLVEECRQDHVGLWEVIDAVRFDLGSSNPDQTRALTLGLVRRLLRDPKILVGHPAPDGRHFVPWKLTPDEACSRIDREWSALGREPTIGDVVWFTTTE